MSEQDVGQRHRMWRTPLGVFMLLAGLTGLYFLLTEHLTHFVQALPYLVLLACPLMHLFHGHGGHGGHHRGAGASRTDASGRKGVRRCARQPPSLEGR